MEHLRCGIPALGLHLKPADSTGCWSWSLWHAQPSVLWSFSFDFVKLLIPW